MVSEGFNRNDTEVLFSWHGLSLRKERVRGACREFDYIYVYHPGSVVIVPVFENGEVLLVEQYRHPIGCQSLEFPAGGKSSDEESVTAAKRELLEEAQLDAGRIIHVGTFYTSNSITNEKVEVFLATELSQAENHGEPDEDFEIQHIRISFNTVCDRIQSGQITDGLTIVASTLCKERIAEMQRNDNKD